MLTISDIAPSNPVAKDLLRRLNKKLLEITGDSGASSYEIESFNKYEDVFIVAILDGVAVACGALKKVDTDTCEVKRMYSEYPGGGTTVLDGLEKRADEMAFKKLILSTRRVNKRAVDFYIKKAFEEIPAYGKYQNAPNSICLGKTLRKPRAE